MHLGSLCFLVLAWIRRIYRASWRHCGIGVRVHGFLRQLAECNAARFVGICWVWMLIPISSELTEEPLEQPLGQLFNVHDGCPSDLLAQHWLDPFLVVSGFYQKLALFRREKPPSSPTRIGKLLGQIGDPSFPFLGLANQLRSLHATSVCLRVPASPKHQYFCAIPLPTATVIMSIFVLVFMWQDGSLTGEGWRLVWLVPASAIASVLVLGAHFGLLAILVSMRQEGVLHNIVVGVIAAGLLALLVLMALSEYRAGDWRFIISGGIVFLGVVAAIWEAGKRLLHAWGKRTP